jgi:hypothetical protein
MATDEQQRAAGKTIQFGPSMTNKPVPQIVNKIHHTIYSVIGAYAAFILATKTQYVPANFQAEVNNWFMLVPVATLIIKQFFGWDFTDCTLNSDKK